MTKRVTYKDLPDAATLMNLIHSIPKEWLEEHPLDKLTYEEVVRVVEESDES